MRTISLAWGHYFDSEIFILVSGGISTPELRPYTQSLGFIDFQTHTGTPLICGYSEYQKDDLKNALRADGYTVGKDRIFSAMPIFLCVSDRAEVSL